MVKYVNLKFDGKIVLNKVKYCDTFFSKVLGLMFSKKLKADEGLLIVARREGRESTMIHMLNVFFPLNVFWLNNEFKVVDKQVAYPFELLLIPKNKAKYVLEVAKGVLDRVKIGSKFTIESKDLKDF